MSSSRRIKLTSGKRQNARLPVALAILSLSTSWALSSAAFAKGAASAGGGGSGGGASSSAVGIGSASTSRDSGIGTKGIAGQAVNASLSTSVNDANAGSLFTTYQSATFPSGAFDPALFPYNIATGPTYAPMSNWGVYAPACITAGAGLMGALGDETHSRAEGMQAISEDAISRTAPYYPQGVDESTGRRYGSDIGKLWRTDEKGCEKFIDKDGKIGPWGAVALEKMQDPTLKHVFDTNVPADITQFCPEFPGMSAARKQYFWLWFMASLAKPESSCRAGAINTQAPNGDALGLFQLEPKKCYPMSSQDLMDPIKNINCAVKVFGNEMSCRRTIMIDTSHGYCGTYFGELRTNPFGPDKGAAAQAKVLLSSYPDCQKTNATSNVPANTETPVRGPAAK